MTTTVMLDADQEEIRGVARGFLQSRYPSARVRELSASEDGFEQSAWEEIAELGWMGIALPEESGGAGYGLIERCLLLEEMGRVLLPGPYLSSAVIAADAVAAAGTGEAAAAILAGIADGSTRATLVGAGDLLGEAEPAGRVSAAAGADGFELSGSGGLTLDGASAQLLIVVAAVSEGVGLFAIDPAASGVERNPAATVDATRKTAVVEFDRSPAQRLDRGEGTAAAISLALDRARISLAAELVGSAQQALEMTVAYMNEREQFGGPIGRFQALKHRLADVHVAIDAAREGVYSAADTAESGQPEMLPMAAAAAKIAASEALVLAGAEGIQFHGGIGFTEEHDIGLFYKRALVGSATLGTPLAQLQRIVAGLDG